MYSMQGSDAEIWTRFKDGDEQVFSSIYANHSRLLYKYGLKFTSRNSVVEDAIQELFLDLIKNRKTIGHTDHIRRYLLKSFRRKLFRQLKKENRYTLKNPEEEFVFEIQYSIEQELVLNDDSDSKSLRLSGALKKLSPRQKEAIYLKFTTGLDYNEIAEIMDMGLESCRNLMYRAIKALKEKVEKKT